MSLAHGLNKQTIAEGVEDRTTELLLRRHGVDLAQGYHIGRPAPIAEGVPLGPPRPADQPQSGAGQAVCVRIVHSLSAVAGIDFGEQMVDVTLHRGLTDEQLGRDLPV